MSTSGDSTTHNADDGRPAANDGHQELWVQPPRAMLGNARDRAHRALFGRAAPADANPPTAPTPADASTDSGRGTQAPAEITRGSTLGRYLVLGTLGHGGMGTIVKAYDEALGRSVAIKLLLYGTTDRHAQRLRREAQALAKLSHPNVVHVYEVGQTNGQWFIAMELVPGRTLRQWHADEHDWRACVRVYLEAGAGLSAAHAASLVHRDFKPDNCIIDEEGRVRVLDFGLVRDTVPCSQEPATVDAEKNLVVSDARQTPMTRSGTVLGTVAYMPPEQLDGQRADARSDQFSFCVSLYEALHGERPFKGESMTSLMDSIREGQIRPAPRKRPVPSALRSILQRGLAADPDARWPSMDALLDALARQVNPPRRRWMALGVTVGLVAMGGGVAAGQYAQVMDRCTGADAQLEGVWDDDRRQRLRSAVLETDRPYALDTWVRVDQTLDQYARDWAARHTAVCEATRVTQEQTEQDMGLRMSCLHEHKVALRATVDVLADADETVVQHAVKLVSGLPRHRRCDDVRALRAAVPPPEDPDIAQQVATMRERLADLGAQQRAGQYPDALDVLQPIVEQADALDYRPLVAEVKARAGALLDLAGRYPEAEVELRQAYALAMELRHDDVARDAARALTWVVGVRQSRHAEAQVWGRVALAHVKRGGEALGPEYEASVLKNIGEVLSAEGELDDALVHQRQSLALLESEPGQHPYQTGTILDSIGITLARQGKLTESRTYQERSLAMMEQMLGDHHPRVADQLNNSSIVLRMQGALDEALAAQLRGLAIHESAWGEDHPAVATALDNVGSVLAAQGKLEDALAHFNRGLAIRRHELGDDHPDIANSLNNIANVVSSQGKLDEAITHYEGALEINSRVLGPDHAYVGGIHNNLGMVLLDQGKLDEALDHLKKALVILETNVGTDHQDVGAALNNIGRVLARQGQLDEALTHYERALAVKEKSLGKIHPRIAASLNNIGSLLHQQGKLEQARTYHQRSLAVWEESFGPDHSELGHALVGLAVVELDLKDFDAARAHAERAVALREAGEFAPAPLAGARFVLAQCLWTDRASRPRARALAEQARDGFQRHGAPGNDDLPMVERWLDKHRG